jgi:hypothetical protein
MESSGRYTKPKPYISLFTPSAIGVVLYTFLSVLIIVLNQFKTIEQYLQVPHNFQIMHSIFSWLDSALTRMIGENSTASLVVGLFWAVVGLGVYIFLRGIAHFISDLGEGYEARGFVWPKGANRNQHLIEAFTRTGFRIVACIGLLVILLGPLAAVIHGPVLTDFIGGGFVATLVFWFIASWITLHLVVVLLRLVILKPRLFG